MRLVAVRVPSMLTCCLQAAAWLNTYLIREVRVRVRFALTLTLTLTLTAGLNTYLIRDAGHTEIEPGSRTVFAVGP